MSENYCVINEQQRMVQVTRCTDLQSVLNHLLTAWVDGDMDLPGICAFMEFAIKDADVDEGTNCTEMAKAVRDWAATNGTQRIPDLLAALEPEIRVRPRSHPDVAAALATRYIQDVL